jgi:hypothetical protein
MRTRGKLISYQYKMQHIQNSFNGGREMMSFLMEAVVISFTMGGIFGAVVAIHLQSRKEWCGEEALIFNDKEEHPEIRRG